MSAHSLSMSFSKLIPDSFVNCQSRAASSGPLLTSVHIFDARVNLQRVSALSPRARPRMATTGRPAASGTCSTRACPTSWWTSSGSILALRPSRASPTASPTATAPLWRPGRGALYTRCESIVRGRVKITSHDIFRDGDNDEMIPVLLLNEREQRIIYYSDTVYKFENSVRRTFFFNCSPIFIIPTY